ncbi:hypothetical protein [Desulfosporosinus sp. BICA1-9]|uniref:hypothetical protein n=1 Tax=Desulfosporosinus sp. BICA1-9 TaxID=1531958 RepID=UPI0025BF6812|nr:hypothetical protein [Desulfosporosinus sp. BICA1-9]
MAIVRYDNSCLSDHLRITTGYKVNSFDAGGDCWHDCNCHDTRRQGPHDRRHGNHYPVLTQFFYTQSADNNGDSNDNCAVFLAAEKAIFLTQHNPNATIEIVYVVNSERPNQTYYEIWIQTL